MGRVPAFVMTAVLAVCFIVQLSSKNGTEAPRGGAFASLLAIGILWAIVLWGGMPRGLRVPALVIFFLITVLGAVLPTVQNSVRSLLDRPGVQAAQTLGSTTSARSIAVVYHAGGSNAVTSAVARLGKDLAARGYSVSMLAASPRLVLDQRKYRAVVLGSPVYSGQVRPPVLDFVSANAPLSVPVFALLTGWFPAMKEQDLGRLSPLVGRAGGRLIAGTKIGSGSSEPTVEKGLASIEQALDISLRRN
jgi:hypothetical protein